MPCAAVIGKRRRSSSPLTGTRALAASDIMTDDDPPCVDEAAADAACLLPLATTPPAALEALPLPLATAPTTPLAALQPFCETAAAAATAVAETPVLPPHPDPAEVASGATASQFRRASSDLFASTAVDAAMPATDVRCCNRSAIEPRGSEHDENLADRLLFVPDKETRPLNFSSDEDWLRLVSDLSATPSACVLSLAAHLSAHSAAPPVQPYPSIFAPAAQPIRERGPGDLHRAILRPVLDVLRNSIGPDIALMRRCAISLRDEIKQRCGLPTPFEEAPACERAMEAFSSSIGHQPRLALAYHVWWPVEEYLCGYPKDLAYYKGCIKNHVRFADISERLYGLHYKSLAEFRADVAIVFENVRRAWAKYEDSFYHDYAATGDYIEARFNEFLNKELQPVVPSQCSLSSSAGGCSDLREHELRGAVPEPRKSLRLLAR